jgi:hypothetical protein
MNLSALRPGRALRRLWGTRNLSEGGDRTASTSPSGPLRTRRAATPARRPSHPRHPCRDRKRRRITRPRPTAARGRRVRVPDQTARLDAVLRITPRQHSSHRRRRDSRPPTNRRSDVRRSAHHPTLLSPGALVVLCHHGVMRRQNYVGAGRAATNWIGFCLFRARFRVEPGWESNPGPAHYERAPIPANTLHENRVHRRRDCQLNGPSASV